MIIFLATKKKKTLGPSYKLRPFRPKQQSAKEKHINLYRSSHFTHLTINNAKTIENKLKFETNKQINEFIVGKPKRNKHVSTPTSLFLKHLI